MDSIVGSFDRFTGMKGKRDDDFIDRLSCRYTMMLLLLFAAIISFYQFGGSPIICWFPVHFTKNHIKFSTSYCWIKNTYYIPHEAEIPNPEEPRHMVVYYQWIPFILLVQALFFFFPSIIWNAFNQKAGVDSDNILASANKLCQTENSDNREGILFMLTLQIHRFLGGKTRTNPVAGSKFRSLLTTCCHMCGKRFSSYLTTLFIFHKFIYIANLFFQLFFLNQLLGTKYHLFDFEVLSGMLKPDHLWRESSSQVFPRVTMCDFNIRRLGNVHRYAAQCILPLNMFNEKIYVFLWFWFVFVLIASIIGVITWILRALMPSDRQTFVNNHLENLDRLKTQKDVKLAKRFVVDYLRQDGVFILRLISHNTNRITTSEIVCDVWDNWLQLPSKIQSPANSTQKLPLDDSDDDDDDDPMLSPPRQPSAPLDYPDGPN